MRIISGLARGRKLFTPGKTKSIRPTSDRAREALFSIIGNRVVSARILDLYAGTGALGVEALSRGARQAVFVDKHHMALELIRKNCALYVQAMEKDLSDEIVIIQHDLRRDLPLKHPQCSEESAPFDLIFLDPPYEQGLAESSLEKLDCSPLLTSTTLVIAEECSGETLPDAFTYLILTDKRRYGETGFWFYTVKES